MPDQPPEQIEGLHLKHHEAVRDWLAERFPGRDPRARSISNGNKTYRWAVQVGGELRFLYVSESAHRDFSPEEVTAALDASNAEAELRAGKGPWLRPHPDDRSQRILGEWPDRVA